MVEKITLLRQKHYNVGFNIDGHIGVGKSNHSNLQLVDVCLTTLPRFPSPTFVFILIHIEYIQCWLRKTQPDEVRSKSPKRQDEANELFTKLF